MLITNRNNTLFHWVLLGCENSGSRTGGRMHASQFSKVLIWAGPSFCLRINQKRHIEIEISKIPCRTRFSGLRPRFSALRASDFGAFRRLVALSPLTRAGGHHMLLHKGPQQASYATGSAPVEALSYSAVKLFSKNSNLCDHDT